MFKNIKNYVQDYVNLAKLEGLEAVGKMAAKVVFILLMLLFVSFFILLGSFAAGFYLNEVYGDSVGFLIVTGFYLIMIILFMVFKKPIINGVVNMVIAASSNSKKD